MNKFEYNIYYFMLSCAAILVGSVTVLVAGLVLNLIVSKCLS